MCPTQFDSAAAVAAGHCELLKWLFRQLNISMNKMRVVRVEEQETRFWAQLSKFVLVNLTDLSFVFTLLACCVNGFPEPGGAGTVALVKQQPHQCMRVWWVSSRCAVRRQPPRVLVLCYTVYHHLACTMMITPPRPTQISSTPPHLRHNSHLFDRCMVHTQHAPAPYGEACCNNKNVCWSKGASLDCHWWHIHRTGATQRQRQGVQGGSLIPCANAPKQTCHDGVL